MKKLIFATILLSACEPPVQQINPYKPTFLNPCPRTRIGSREFSAHRWEAMAVLAKKDWKVSGDTEEERVVVYRRYGLPLGWSYEDGQRCYDYIQEITKDKR